MSLLPRKQPEIPELYILTQLLPLFPVDNEGYKKHRLNNMKSKRVAISGPALAVTLNEAADIQGQNGGQENERSSTEDICLIHGCGCQLFSGYVHVRRLRNFFLLAVDFRTSRVEASATLGCFCQEIWLTWGAHK
ncbi:hypothetical protein CDAR_561671 [Caerostris darwini]|uniref:Uncharacterized protein n=1 Tax=Caerostris darwini TaxID=1538125 RepID=A0AAV4MN32_9ARAC|nr:hypothetical protein CDAR_561671 [Caerostris darwini]